jgi:RNA polymerase sigma factor (sigma-70 family)
MDPAMAARVDPEDVLSLVFAKAMKRWPQFKESGQAAYPWLRQLLLDCLYAEYDRHRAKGRDVRRDRRWPDRSSLLLGLGLVSPGTTPSKAADRHEQEERLKESLALLRPEYRDLLHLLYAEGRTTQEAAQVLEVPEGTARQWHARALRKLKDLWIQRYGAEGLEP